MIKKVSVIVPVYNEEKTIANVVKTLLSNNLVNQVICVNDGSTDKTQTILKSFKDKILFIDFKINRGKGFALSQGIKKAENEIIVFCDADLTTLSDKHITTLVSPILKGKVIAVLGYPSKNKTLCFPNIFSRLTGQRAYYKKDLLPHLEKLAKTRYGVEIFLNNVFDKKKTKRIPLKGLKGLYKYEKRNSLDTFKEYLGEVVDIAQEIARQESLPFEEYDIISKLAKTANIKDLKGKIQKIKSKKIKHFLSKYLVKYMKIR